MSLQRIQREVIKGGAESQETVSDKDPKQACSYGELK